MNSKRTNQLHTLLASGGDRKRITASIIKEGIKTFGERTGHFSEMTRTFDCVDDDALKMQDEHDPMVTTVDEKISYIWDSLISSIDMDFQIEYANTEAKADVILPDGSIFASSVPATGLLNIQGYLRQLIQVYSKTPTLPPGHKWTPSNNRNGIYDAQPKESLKMAKLPEPITLHEGNEHHPPQTELIYRDKPTHRITTSISCGMWTSRKKSDTLGRIQTLIDSVSAALSEANRTPVGNQTIAKDLRNYIEG